MRSLSFSIGLVLLAGASAGCGGPDGPPPPVTHKVEGQVIYKGGKAFAKGGVIEFQHDTKPGATSLGPINADGTFSLYTLTAQQKLPGIQEGSYTVTITPASKDQRQAVQPIHLEKKYTIAAGDNQLTIEIDD